MKIRLNWLTLNTITGDKNENIKYEQYDATSTKNARKYAKSRSDISQHRNHTGHYDCKKVDIDNSLLEEDKEMLEDLVAAAINDAVRKVANIKKDKLGGLAAGMNIPVGLDALLK